MDLVSRALLPRASQCQQRAERERERTGHGLGEIVTEMSGNKVSADEVPMGDDGDVLHAALQQKLVGM